MAVASLAVIITSFNRRGTTLACLKALYEQITTLPFDVYLTDDQSPDGTAEAVKACYPMVHVLKGTGQLFWCGGMRLAWQAAMDKSYDYYLWLNDDTRLDPDAVDRLTKVHKKLERTASIVVGATRHPNTSRITYGGVLQPNPMHPFKFVILEPSDTPLPCDTMNGNCVLIPAEVVRRVGNLSSTFTHGFGDYDYGLRARQHGCEIWLAPSSVGRCSDNDVQGTWEDRSLPLKERWQKLTDTKGLPFHEWRAFVRRHGGILWPVFWLSPYIKVFAQGLLQRVPRRG